MFFRITLTISHILVLIMAFSHSADHCHHYHSLKVLRFCTIRFKFSIFREEFIDFHLCVLLPMEYALPVLEEEMQATLNSWHLGSLPCRWVRFRVHFVSDRSSIQSPGCSFWTRCQSTAYQSMTGFMLRSV